MTDVFRIKVADVPTRENLVAEIYYYNKMWVEISQETEDLLIQFYTYPHQEYWEFPFDLMMQTLEKAKEGLLRIGQPDKTRAQALQAFILMGGRHVVEWINSLFLLIGVFLRLRENFKLVKTLSKTKKVMVEIYYNKILWAVVFQEVDNMLVRFYPNPKKDYLEFPIDLPIQIWKMAKETFETGTLQSQGKFSI
ncbi:MAG: hypothetical protein V4489_00050, partial [Chlamydiota bacterium]